MPSSREQPTRRRLLAALGTSLTGVSLAGCSDRSDSPATATATDQPSSSTSTSPKRPETRTQETDHTVDTPTPDDGSLVAPWPTARGDAANTGRVDATGPRGEPSVKWTGYVGLETDRFPAVGPDGPVFVRADGRVVALDDDGTVRWRTRPLDETRLSPVVTPDGGVVLGSGTGRVVLLDADGTVRWDRTLAAGVGVGHANDETGFTLTSDSVVVTTVDGTVVSLALDDGTRRWRTDTPRTPHRPVARDGRVFLVAENRETDESRVLALDAADGETLWERSVPGSVSVGPGYDDGVVYVTNIDGLVVALSADSGESQWRVRLPEEPWISTIPVVFDDRVWVGTLDEGLYAVDGDGDGVALSVDVPLATTPAVADGRLYVGQTQFGSGDGDGSVAAVGSDGTVQWRTSVRGPVEGLRVHDGTVFVGTETGIAVALDASDGTVRWRQFQRPARLPTPVIGPGGVYLAEIGNQIQGYKIDDGAGHLWGVRFDAHATGTPAILDGLVVSGGGDGTVDARPPSAVFEPTDRLVRTPTPAPDATAQPHVDYPVPEAEWRTTVGDTVGDVGAWPAGLVCGSGTSLLALRRDGSQRWRVDAGGPVRRVPAVADGTVYATTTGGDLVAVDTSGTKQWTLSVGRSASAPVVAVGLDLVAVGTDRGVVAVDTDGTERWRVGTAPVRSAPAVAESLVLAGDDGGRLRAVEADGTVRWDRQLGGAIRGSPAVADGVAYVGTRARRLVAVDTTDGTTNWRLRLSDWVDGAPAVAHGAVFVVDQSRRLWAVVGE
ncbi:MAG: PQQ-binding-like beta-propeller repeat protein [Halobaculum sp.]